MGEEHRVVISAADSAGWLRHKTEACACQNHLIDRGIFIFFNHCCTRWLPSLSPGKLQLQSAVS